MQGWTATTRHGVMRKGSTKVLNKHIHIIELQEICLQRTYN